MAKKRKRVVNVFTLSFLDVMAGGFGAVILIFLIINHTIVKTEKSDPELLNELRLIDFQMERAKKNRAELMELVGDLRNRIADAKERVEELLREVETKTDEVDDAEKSALDLSTTLERIKSEIQSLQREIELLESRDEASGETPIEIVGEGDRQYLTGLYVGGNHILIALDMSASMLDKTIVNIVRKRNMSVERQLNSPKWRRAIDTVEWLAANLPLDSKVQIAGFNESVEFLVGDDDWSPVIETDPVIEAIQLLRETPPEGGTNLERLFIRFSEMDPLPDNIFLITDGLPTMDDSNRSKRKLTVSANERHSLFLDIQRSMVPIGVTINVILFPLEGDPWAAGAFWSLCYQTAGTFMTPSEDWP